jgi:hypothetical protein
MASADLEKIVLVKSTDVAIDTAEASTTILPQGLSTVNVEERYAFVRTLYRIRKQYYPKLAFLQALFIQFEFSQHLPFSLTLRGYHDIDYKGVRPADGTDMGPWRFTGEVLNGLRHGVGTCTWPDRNGGETTYEGRWAHGLAHGACRVTSARGYVFEGQCYNGIKHGRGKFMYTSGDVYEVEYDDKGELQGKDTMTFAANGVVVEGMRQKARASYY